MIVYYIFLLVLGLLIGSFVSVVSFRVPNGVNFIKGRSFCPKCNNRIPWYDNIPLLSFIFLKGRCRRCQKKISLRYPLIEIASGIGFLTISIFALPNFIKMVYLLIVFSLLLIIFIIDLENQIIPDSLVFVLMGVVVIYHIITQQTDLYANLLSGFLASSFLLSINMITKGRGMGLGDVKFAIAGGMFIGLTLMPIWMFLSFLTGAISGSILILLRKKGLKSKIAFGPFLIIGLLLAEVFGEMIINLIGL